jgi:hypothetical protein
MTRSALSRRAASGAVRQVLPRVYVQGVRELDVKQRCRAALLYAGPPSCLTGEAALVWRRIEHLPREVTAERVDVLIPGGRSVASRDWVRITRTRELPWSITVDGVPTARPTRAVIDATLRLSSYETVLAVVSAVVNAGRASVEELVVELDSAPRRGSKLVGRALSEAVVTWSIPEAVARELFRRGGLPNPDVNLPILVAGRRFVPDFRWGKVIVEIESRAHHLLEPGAWEATQRRHALLRAAGYVVLPVTPEQLRDAPGEVIAMIWTALAQVNAP